VINVVLIMQFLQEPPIEGPLDMGGCDAWPPSPTCQCTVNNTNPTATVQLPGYGWALAGVYGVGYFFVCACMMKEELLAAKAFVLALLSDYLPASARPKQVWRTRQLLDVVHAPSAATTSSESAAPPRLSGNVS
jgi:hypothetical protein